MDAIVRQPSPGLGWSTRGHHHRAHHGSRRGRWVEPFVLLLVAQGPTYGYKLIGELNELGVAPEGIDVGMVYRTLRSMDADGLVTTEWGPQADQPRREYRLTDEGACALRDWMEVMKERKRLIEHFLERGQSITQAQGE
ncbi:MAG TPA: PadR family transcriptional regulator [Anaerolineae bacterium]|jgi:PadR family transcriptional regulator, regulatory protein PadR|nr:PadR family transcriptional regulator [Anaerolineae bacterium]